MVKRIRAELKASPFKWIGKKVKAHQDKAKDYDQLTSWEKANVCADKVAKQHLDPVQHQPRPTHNRVKSEGRTFSLEKTHPDNKI